MLCLFLSFVMWFVSFFVMVSYSYIWFLSFVLLFLSCFVYYYYDLPCYRWHENIALIACLPGGPSFEIYIYTYMYVHRFWER